MLTRQARLVVLVVPLVLLGARVVSTQSQQPRPVEIPAGVTVLEGVPSVRVETGENGATRRVLDTAEAEKDRLRINVVDGQYYWTSRGNRVLRMDASGPFTYLSSEPGQYVRFTRMNDRIAYVEHVDTALGSVTWWGEMKIVVGSTRR